MESIYTMYVADYEMEKLEGLIEKYSADIKDWEKSKIFSVQGNSIAVYNMITTDLTFMSITEEMNATRIY